MREDFPSLFPLKAEIDSQRAILWAEFYAIRSKRHDRETAEDYAKYDSAME